jgi:hypothetical protein
VERLPAEPEEIIEHAGLCVIVVYATAHGHESAVDVDAHTVHVGSASRTAAWRALRDTPRSVTRGAALVIQVRYLPVAAGGGLAWCGVEPLSPTAETPKAAAHSAIVATRM